MKMRAPLTALILAGVVTLPAVAGDNVATVNGKPITKAMVEAFGGQQHGAKLTEQQLVDALITQEVAAQQATKQGLEKDPEVAAAIELQKRSVLASALMQGYLKKNTVSAEEVKKVYDEKIAKADREEYKARHILLKTEDEAKAVIAELDKGADFTELAKSKSTGPSAKDGGDLGWFGPAQMVPPFSEAVKKLEKGAYTKAPVQTQFGWHVIKLEESRKAEPPKYEEVKARIQAALQNQKLVEYMSGLREKAKIEMK